jgi:hypothetical protein
MTGNLPGTQCGPHLYCQKDEKIGKSVCVSRELTNFSQLIHIQFENNLNKIQTNCF